MSLNPGDQISLRFDADNQIFKNWVNKSSGEKQFIKKCAKNSDLFHITCATYLLYYCSG